MLHFCRVCLSVCLSVYFFSALFHGAPHAIPVVITNCNFSGWYPDHRYLLLQDNSNASPTRKSVVGSKSDQARVAALEEEVQELKRKLSRADSRLVRPSAVFESTFDMLPSKLGNAILQSLHIPCCDILIFHCWFDLASL
jgi:hypothetical protein